MVEKYDFQIRIHYPNAAKGMTSKNHQVQNKSEIIQPTLDTIFKPEKIEFVFGMVHHFDFTFKPILLAQF